MLKETDTEETSLAFLSNVYHWWHFNWGSGGGPGLQATPMNQNAAHNLMIFRN